MSKQKQFVYTAPNCWFTEQSVVILWVTVDAKIRASGIDLPVSNHLDENMFIYILFQKAKDCLLW